MVATLFSDIAAETARWMFKAEHCEAYPPCLVPSITLENAQSAIANVTLDETLQQLNATLSTAMTERRLPEHAIPFALLFGPHVLLVLFLVRAVLSTMWSVFTTWRAGGVRGLCKQFAGMALRVVKASVPGVAGLIDSEVRKNLAGLERELLGDGDASALTVLPTKGLSQEEVAAKCDAMRSSDAFITTGGKLWGGIYHDASSELTELQARVWATYNTSNALYPKEFASVRKMEAELVSMAVGMVHGHEVGAVGLLASGGTEAVLLAALGYREQGRARGISRPQIVCGVSAHPASALQSPNANPYTHPHPHPYPHISPLTSHLSPSPSPLPLPKPAVGSSPVQSSRPAPILEWSSSKHRSTQPRCG